MADGWTAEWIKDGVAFLVTPGGQRVGEMTPARARGIAAALNTAEGTKAFMLNRYKADADDQEFLYSNSSIENPS